MTTMDAAPASLLDRLALATPEVRAAALARLDPAHQRELAAGARPWWLVGRNDQMAPAGDWRWWVILAGRGFGKTRTGGEKCKDWMTRYPGCRAALIAPTFTDGRDTMVEGESGLLSHTDFTQLRGGSYEDGWNRSMGELYFANGSRAKVFSSEQPWRLRGPQHHYLWGDEPSYWRDAAQGTAKDTTFSNANIGLRLPPRPGWPGDYRPRGVLTMTPRLVPLLKIPEPMLAAEPARAGLLQRTDVAITRGTTMANLRNLDRTYYEAVIAPLIGTTLGIQELGGVLLEDVEGALWHQGQIDADRAAAPDDLSRRVVAFDPAGTDNRDEHGIVVIGSAGTRNQLHAYVLADLSGNATPTVAAQTAIWAAFTHEADAIVYEKNQGQDWIPSTIQLTYTTLRADPEWAEVLGDWRLPQLVAVTATKKKEQRAVPVQMMSQQHRLHLAGSFPLLEAQMTTWVPGESDSPDRLDAMVWGVLDALGEAHGETGIASAARRERGRRTAAMPSTQLPAVYGYRGVR